MKLDQETLEILMGKHLDGEISIAEARLLKGHLQEGPEARRLLDELQALHRRSQEALSGAVQGRGRSAQDIIDSAMQQSREPANLRGIKHWVCSQFTAGLAAGLLISAGVLLLVRPHATQTPQVRTAREPSNPSSQFSTDPAFDPRAWVPQVPGVERDVDWIMFTDLQGEHYLIEGLREATRAQPAVYQRDF